MVLLFGYIMILAFIAAVICLIFGVVAFIEDDEATVPLFIVGFICLTIFIMQSQVNHKDEVIFYSDEYNIIDIKEELDTKGIKGKDKQISMTDREYIKTYYSRFDGCTYYEYGVHPGDIQIEELEKYKK